MRKLFASALVLGCVCVIALPALASQSTTGTVASIDTKNRTITLTDKTVYDLRQATPLATEIAPGAKVTVHYLSEGEDGIEKILGVTRF